MLDAAVNFALANAAGVISGATVGLFLSMIGGKYLESGARSLSRSDLAGVQPPESADLALESARLSQTDARSESETASRFSGAADNDFSDETDDFDDASGVQRLPTRESEVRRARNLFAETGLCLSRWIAIMETSSADATRNGRIDWGMAQGLSFADASWIERALARGGLLFDDATTVADVEAPSPSAPVRSAFAPQAARVFMRPADHAIEFIAAMRACRLGKNPVTGRHELRSTARGVVDLYLAWAQQSAVAVIPESMFLGFLSDQPGVIKSRDRLKCPHSGRVLKNAHGTPLRGTYYTIVAAADVASEAPKRSRRAPTPAPLPPDHPSRAPLGPWTDGYREIAREAA